MIEKLILLVEDNPDDELLTLRAFKKNNILNRVVVARDGAEAIDFLLCKGAHVDRDPDDLPEIILLDLKLPKMNGFEVLRHLKKDPEFKSIPVVMLTTSAREEEIAMDTPKEPTAM